MLLLVAVSWQPAWSVVRNVMKPWIQCVLAHWIRGSTTSGSRPIFMINIS